MRANAPVTKRGYQPKPRKAQRLRGQTMLVVLRIAAVRSDIGVFLNDPGPRLAGTIEKDAFTSLLCPGTPGSRHVRMRHRPR